MFELHNLSTIYFDVSYPLHFHSDLHQEEDPCTHNGSWDHNKQSLYQDLEGILMCVSSCIRKFLTVPVLPPSVERTHFLTFANFIDLIIDQEQCSCLFILLPLFEVFLYMTLNHMPLLRNSYMNLSCILIHSLFTKALSILD